MKLFLAVLYVSSTMGLTRCYKTEGFFTFIITIRPPQSLTLLGVLRNVRTLYPLAEWKCNCYVIYIKSTLAFCHANYTWDLMSEEASATTLMADKLLAVRRT